MMSSEQLKAFDVSQEPASVRAEYGDTPFGRGCLAARRLTEVGVRCVEVTLDGWDTHVNNHAFHSAKVKILDPAFAALLRDLKRRNALDRTIVLCCGEFGRTPKINLAGGRDHWTNGYSIALAGGGLRGGLAIGETDPEGVKDPARPASVEDVHATVLSALGLNPAKENIAPATSRPIKLSCRQTHPRVARLIAPRSALPHLPAAAPAAHRSFPRAGGEVPLFGTVEHGPMSSSPDRDCG